MKYRITFIIKENDFRGVGIFFDKDSKEFAVGFHKWMFGFEYEKVEG